MRKLQVYIDDVMSSEEKEKAVNIVENIKKINEKLMRPKRPQVNFNFKHDDQKDGQLYVLDEDTLKKLGQYINYGYAQNTQPQKYGYERENQDIDEDNKRETYSRALNPYLVAQPYLATNEMTSNAAIIPYSFANYNMPVIMVPMPVDTKLYQNSINSEYTRQTPSIPFQIPWPLAPFFPILIKDPLLTFIHGGGFNNLFEYGQSADVCSNKHVKSGKKSDEIDGLTLEDDQDVLQENDTDIKTISHREGRSIRKRTISNYAPKQNVDSRENRKSNKLLKNKIVKRKPQVHQVTVEEEEDNYKKGNEPEGDLRWPFGDYGWFGNKKPVAPSPGFFINRLKVRRGGVAIAGPGGVATAGRGGTAIVGPGGLAYTQPGGLAIAGPSAKVVALSGNTDLSDLVSKLHEAHTSETSFARRLTPIPEGKVVATGPVVYYHKTDDET